MSARHTVLGAVLAALLACTGASGPDAHDEHGHDEDGHDEHGHDGHGDHADGHEDPAGVLEIGPEVLRDLRFTTAPARVGGSEERATILGELAVDEERYAEIGAPGTARVRSLEVQASDPVEAGQALATLESAEVARARADLAGARARLATARRGSERAGALTGGTVSPREAEAAARDLSVAEAEERAAVATLSALGAGTSTEGGGTLVLRSPLAGTVIERQAHRGAMVEPHDTLFRVADLSSLWLVVHAFERDALRVTPGTPVDVAFPALPNRVVHGEVERVGQQVDPVSRTVPVRVVLPNPDGLLRPGMSASALLPLGDSAGVVTVPGEAIQRCDAGWCVFLPQQPGHFEVRPVGRGRDLAGEVEVLSGLEAGEQVVVEGAFLLRAEAAKRAGGGDAHHH